ncbi:MAG TPA: LptE family protein [Gemmatimonadales bacterium]|nr:LptE family protein [Gemmatimonadales bacterium]
MFRWGRPGSSSRWSRGTRPPCSRRRSGATVAKLASPGGALLLGACVYGFAGGGFAPHIKTVAILPFDNLTPEPSLTQEVSGAVREALEDRLGLRLAGESTADAVVRGRVVRYDPDVPLTLRPGERQVEVTQRQVQLTVDVEIIDQREGKTLWAKRGLTVVGEYRPPQEAEGRKIALQKLVTDIVDGAQSQW